MKDRESLEARDNGSDKNSEKQTYSLEIPLKKDIFGKLIKSLRKVKNYSQEKLGIILGVQKAQISRLEKSDRNISLVSMIRIFHALKTKVSFKIELEKKKDLIVLQDALKESVKESEIKNAS